MAIPKRGLTNIRTQAGRVDQMRIPYRSYMQITCLEMEKERRGSERRSAMERVAAIDARLLTIEQEKAGLLAQLGSPRAPSTRPTRKREQVVGHGADRPPATAPFKIRY